MKAFDNQLMARAVAEDNVNLTRCLTGFDLVLLGVGAIIGAGIFVLTGIAAATKAGPAIVFSYVMAGLASAFSALSYAELASAIGGCGSAYSYAIVGIGDLVAWIIGWNLLLEYGIICSVVAKGWSSYFVSLLNTLGLHIPVSLTTGPFNHGLLDLPSVVVIALVACFLILGVKTTARINAMIVLLKLAVIGLFLYVATHHINLNNWHVFAPFGWSGVMQGAALIFFAYIGFDAVSTAAEETINPQKNLPIGILGSLIICTILYMVVSALLTLIAPYATLDNAAPLSNALSRLGYQLVVSAVSVGAIAGLTTVVLVMFYGLTRIILAMSRDYMLPHSFAKLNVRTHTPIKMILVLAIIMTTLSALIPIDDLAEMANIGTLTAFTIVCASVIILRRTKPEMPRPFKVPLTPIIPALGIICCLYLIISLQEMTWIRFVVWSAIGFIIYYAYSRKMRLALK